ncbi:MAG: hypothetical protein AAF430_13280 [Myxococcota bacterium]
MGAEAVWSAAGSSVASVGARAATSLHPRRIPLATAGLASFLVAVAPLVGVVHGWTAPAPWHALWFAAWVPAPFWGLGLALFASFFEPARGVLAELSPGTRRSWPARLFRGYANCTVLGFAIAPFVVWTAALL